MSAGLVSDAVNQVRTSLNLPCAQTPFASAQ